MPAEQLSLLCELAVGLCLTFLGLAVLPLHALPFAKRGAMSLPRCSAARLTWVCANRKGRAAGNSLRADRTPEPATDAAGALHRSAPLSFQEGYDIP